jgi:flavine halogenase
VNESASLSTDECGWGWFIPLHDGTVSVGIVMDSATSAAKKAAGTAASEGKGHTLKDHYLLQLDFVPGLKKLLDGASMKEGIEGPSVKSATDYSYAASCYGGDHYRLVGDASGRFITVWCRILIFSPDFVSSVY